MKTQELELYFNWTNKFCNTGNGCKTELLAVPHEIT